MTTTSEHASELASQLASELSSGQAPKRKRRRAARTSSTSSPAETIRLHPLLRGRLITDDLRRMEILRVHDSLAVDVIVRNRPVTGR